MSDFYKKLYEKPVAQVDAPPQLPVDVDFLTLVKSEIPALVAHAIALAKQSDKLNEVMTALNYLTDRAYGRAAQHIDMVSKSEQNNHIKIEVVYIDNTPTGSSSGVPRVIDAKPV